jgi:UDP-N-acetylglucosamine transferase subunit ALG13
VILVLVGTHAVGFNRLVQAADQLAACISEKVIIQTGDSAYQPQHSEFFAYTSGACLEQLAIESRVIITHAAAGSILLAMRLGRPLVLVPRLKRFGEALDDHQQQLAKALAPQYNIPVMSELTAESLLEGIQKAGQLNRIFSGGLGLTQALRQQLSDWDRVMQLDRTGRVVKG